ncbi:MAG: hypothetical protein KBD24_02675 [Candidatus Pacebacteria bacterium]|nr:hypothetical protein [Candidatus Paceibacterota bacterium]
MFGSRSSGSDAYCYALFDVGASSIEASLGQRDAVEGERLLWHMHLEYAYEHTDDYEHYVKSMYATLLEAGMAMLNDGLRVAQRESGFNVRCMEVKCTFARPWFIAEVETETRSYEKHHTVTHGLLDEMRASIFTKILARPDYISWQEVAGQGDILEQQDLPLLLDGYHVLSNHPYEACEITLSTYMAIVSQSVMQHVGEILLRVLPNHPVRMTTSTRVLATHRFTHEHTAREILVEVGGQVTSVAILDQKAITGVATLPFGTHHFLHACAPRAKSIEEASSAGVLMIKKASEEGAEFPKEVATVLADWSEAVHEAIRIAVRGVTPPPLASIAIDPLWYETYANILGRPWSQPGLREMCATQTVPLDRISSQHDKENT